MRGSEPSSRAYSREEASRVSISFHGSIRPCRSRVAGVDDGNADDSARRGVRQDQGYFRGRRADLGGIARSDRLRCDPETRVLLRRREGGPRRRTNCRASILPSVVRPGVHVGIPAESSNGDGSLRFEAAKCGQSLSWTTIFPCEPLAAGPISILNGLPSFDLPVTASPETAASTPCFLNWSI